MPGARRARRARTGASRRARSARIAELTGGSRGRARRRRAPAARPRAGRGQPADPRVRPIRAARGRRPRRGGGPGRSTGRAGCSTCRSPIGLGHAARDVAIVDELRRQRPGRPGRLAGPAPGHRGARPARRARAPGVGGPGQRVARTSTARPASTTCTRSRRDPPDGRDPGRQLHGLRRPGRAEPYDLWVGDEAWELDYFLHENPELKTAAYAWLTDFVGWLPMGRTAAEAGADRRLQRRDGRADRALPAAAGPGDLRR